MEQYTLCMGIHSAPPLVGEIIESTSSSFVAQCPKRPANSESDFKLSPPLGSFVFISQADEELFEREENETLDEYDPFLTRSVKSLLPRSSTFAIVSLAQAVSIDPSRRPTALGVGSERQLRLTQPHIFELLNVEFSALIIGCTDNEGKLRQRLPDVPPRIHSFAYGCNFDVVRILTDDLSFIRSIFAASSNFGLQPDDLIPLVLSNAWVAHERHEEYLVRAGRAVLQHVQSDFNRFQAIISKARV